MNEPDLYGIPAEAIALLCKVNVRTARRWKSGERRMPKTARMILVGDLGCFDPAHYDGVQAKTFPKWADIPKCGSGWLRTEIEAWLTEHGERSEKA